MENTIELYAATSSYAHCVDLVIVYVGAPIQCCCRLNNSEIENLLRWRHTSREQCLSSAQRTSSISNYRFKAASHTFELFHFLFENAGHRLQMNFEMAPAE